MKELPSNIPRKNLRYHWIYRDEQGNPCSIVVRYDDPGKKKRYHQYRLSYNGDWVFP
jgi:hypothetical protein